MCTPSHRYMELDGMAFRLSGPMHEDNGIIKTLYMDRTAHDGLGINAFVHMTTRHRYDLLWYVPDVHGSIYIIHHVPRRRHIALSTPHSWSRQTGRIIK